MKRGLITSKLIIEKMKEPLLAFLAANLITSYIMSHTQIPTESMKPTINPGNHLIVNRLPYYYRNPNRGEVIVFEHEDEHLIKRVIGIPGDEINLLEGKVYLNGVLLDESMYLNELDVTYPFSQPSIEFPYIVPEEHYFVLGDNRRNSSDSRLFGSIPIETIIAQAGYRIFPIKEIGVIK